MNEAAAMDMDTFQFLLNGTPKCIRFKTDGFIYTLKTFLIGSHSPPVASTTLLLLPLCMIIAFAQVCSLFPVNLQRLLFTVALMCPIRPFVSISTLLSYGSKEGWSDFTLAAEEHIIFPTGEESERAYFGVFPDVLTKTMLGSFSSVFVSC